MVDFIELANKKEVRKNREIMSWSAEEPYLFSEEWRDKLKIASFGEKPLENYKKFGGIISDYECGGRFGSGIITKCHNKINFGFYNMSTSKAVFKNTVGGVGILLPYFTGAVNKYIYQLLNAFPVYVYYRKMSYFILVACNFNDLAKITEKMIIDHNWFLQFNPIFKKNRNGEDVAYLNSFSSHCDECDIIHFIWDFQ